MHTYPYEVYCDLKPALELLRLVKYFATKGEGYLYMKNTSLMARFNVKSERTIQNWINKLKRYELIRVELVSNKYRRIYFNAEAERLLKCGVSAEENAGSNNEVREAPKGVVCEATIQSLSETYGNDLVRETLNEMATRPMIQAPLAYLKTVLTRKQAKRTPCQRRVPSAQKQVLSTKAPLEPQSNTETSTASTAKPSEALIRLKAFQQQLMQEEEPNENPAA